MSFFTPTLNRSRRPISTWKCGVNFFLQWSVWAHTITSILNTIDGINLGFTCTTQHNAFVCVNNRFWCRSFPNMKQVRIWLTLECFVFRNYRIVFLFAVFVNEEFLMGVYHKHTHTYWQDISSQKTRFGFGRPLQFFDFRLRTCIRLLILFSFPPQFYAASFSSSFLFLKPN